MVKGAWDFRIKRPAFLKAVTESWAAGQAEYEDMVSTYASVSYEVFLEEIDSVREIYTQVYPIHGSVLDVGGNDGRLRHFLPADSHYLSVDPFLDVFRFVAASPNLLKAYPRLAEPCPFVCAFAEYLPIRSSSFDFVHMRSVIDHFADPFLALMEARRVLVDGGRLIVGLHVTGGKSALAHSSSRLGQLIARTRFKIERDGLRRAVLDGGRRLAGLTKEDAHMWHPTYEELVQLIEFTGFRMEKEHWQKPPYGHVVYIMASKISARCPSSVGSLAGPFPAR
jgi:SAM-dependent methyltransferase